MAPENLISNEIELPQLAMGVDVSVCPRRFIAFRQFDFSRLRFSEEIRKNFCVETTFRKKIHSFPGATIPPPFIETRQIKQIATFHVIVAANSER